MLLNERGLSSASGGMWAERNASQPSRKCIHNTHMFSCDFAKPLGISTRLAGSGETLRVNLFLQTTSSKSIYNLLKYSVDLSLSKNTLLDKFISAQFY